MSVEALAIAVVAAPILLNFFKAIGLPEDAPWLPYLGGVLGFVICLAATWLLDYAIDKAAIVTCIVAAFGPSGFYELLLKKVPVVGSAGKSSP
jgi:thiol:disulfide interchange protein